MNLRALSFALSLLFTISSAFAANKIEISAYKECVVALISDADAAGKANGWWDVWHERKKIAEEGATPPFYGKTPVAFGAVPPGTYTVVVYDPASVNYDPNSGDFNQRSDGLALQSIEVTAETQIKFNFQKNQFIEWNCLSCPWLYLHDGTEYQRTTEVLKDLAGPEYKTTTEFALSADAVVDGKVRIRIQEEKQEITYLDACVLMLGDVEIPAQCSDREVESTLATIDEDALVLKMGEKVDLWFSLPEDADLSESLVLRTNGYYVPDAKYLSSIREKYLGKEE